MDLTSSSRKRLMRKSQVISRAKANRNPEMQRGRSLAIKRMAKRKRSLAIKRMAKRKIKLETRRTANRKISLETKRTPRRSQRNRARREKHPTAKQALPSKKRKDPAELNLDRASSVEQLNLIQCFGSCGEHPAVLNIQVFIACDLG